MNSQNPDNIYDGYMKLVLSRSKIEPKNILDQVKAKQKPPSSKQIEKQKSEFRLGMLQK